MENPVFVTDVGYTKVGDHWESSISELAFKSSQKILRKSSVLPESVIVANAVAGLSSSQQNLGPQIANALQLEGVSAFSVEAAGASGGAAIFTAANLIKSGEFKSVLVIGVEKMRDLDPAKVTTAQGLSENAEYSQFFGLSFASINALIARIYMRENNVKREELSSFPVVAHHNSSTADHAQFRKKFTVDEVARSEIVSEPLRVLDCPPVGDGSASTLLVNGAELSKEQKRESVRLVASENSSSIVNFFERENLLRFVATELAAAKAMKKGGIDRDDIDFFEIHDSYSIFAALSVEGLGLSKPGRACEDATSGKFSLSGKYPISTFGGMKARGYPIGAAGVYQLCETFLQLTGQAKSNQVPKASRGLIQNISGVDGSSFVHILESGNGSLES